MTTEVHSNNGTSCNTGGTLSINGGTLDLKLAPGYRFKPRDSELVIYYLKRKVEGQPLPANCVKECKIYMYDPETLEARYKPKDGNEMFFFTPRDRKYKRGSRPDRAVDGGYWKASGKDTPIESEGEIVGYKKTLVFYRGKPKDGEKTNWLMHEYRLTNPPLPCGSGENGMKLDDYVLCKIYKNDRNSKTTAENQISGEARGSQTNPEANEGRYGDNVNTLIGGSTVTSYGDNQSIMVGNNLHGYGSSAGFSPNNHLVYRHIKVPQSQSNNAFDYSAKVAPPLSSIGSNLRDVMMNEYSSTNYMPNTVLKKEEEASRAQYLHRYNYLNEEHDFEAQEQEPYYYFPEHLDFSMLDNGHAQGEEGSLYNIEEAYKVQELPPCYNVIGQSVSPVLDEVQPKGKEDLTKQSDCLVLNKFHARVKDDSFDNNSNVFPHDI